MIYTLRQSVFIRGSTGDPLPTVFQSLDNSGTRFLRGQLALICSAPGIGKSALVLNYALRARVPALYFSADSDWFTQSTRALSIMTGETMERSAARVKEGSIGQSLDDLLVRFNYSSSPSLPQLESTMSAYEEVYGDYPELVVVDNVTNVRTGTVDNDDNPFGGMEVLMEYLHEMARESGACVIGLHHVTGPHNDGCKPIPLSGIKGQIGRVPEMVLTLHRPQQEFGEAPLNISTVKNRSGRANPSGYEYASLRFDASTMTITDY